MNGVVVAVAMIAMAVVEAVAVVVSMMVTRSG
jgi:hypothetical protein